MSLPDELREALRIKQLEDTVVYLTTASLAGLPNVSVHQFTDVQGEYVLLPDLFAQKTKVNLNENQRATLTIATPEALAGWVIEGPANVIQWGHPAGYRFFDLRAGDVLERWGNWEEREPIDQLPEEVRPAVIAQRGVLVVKAERVHRPGGQP